MDAWNHKNIRSCVCFPNKTTSNSQYCYYFPLGNCKILLTIDLPGEYFHNSTLGFCILQRLSHSSLMLEVTIILSDQERDESVPHLQKFSLLVSNVGKFVIDERADAHHDPPYISQNA